MITKNIHKLSELARNRQMMSVALSLLGVAGGSKLAQAETSFLPIEVLAAEQLQDGSIRVSTPEGWAVLKSDEWALAEGQVMVREGVVLETTKIIPWAQVGYAVGGAGIVGGAALGSYGLIVDELDVHSSSASDTASEPEPSAETGSEVALDAVTDDGEPEMITVAVEPEDTQPNQTTGTSPETQIYDSYFTGNTLIDSLLSADQEHWAGAGRFNQPATVTFSFADEGSALSVEQGVAVQAIPESFRDLVREQLEGIEAVANIDFVEVADTQMFDPASGDGRGQINFALAEDNLDASFAVLPLGEEPWLEDRNGDIVFSAGMLDEGLWVDEYRGGAMTITHEVLHALGLEHPFAGYAVAPDYVDTQFYSLLSYTSAHTDTYFPNVPMIADIAAIQHLYGANLDTNAGDDVYAFDSQSAFLGTIWDAGGTDTIRHTGTRDAVINLNAGQPSEVGASPTHSNVYSVESIGYTAEDVIDWIEIEDPSDGWAHIREDGKAFRLVHDPDTSDLDGDGLMAFTAFFESGQFERYVVQNDDVEVGLRENLHISEGVLIENAEGGQGDDVLIGNTADNRLSGGAGDDILNGGAGADVFAFGTDFGNDVIQDFTIGEDQLDFSGMVPMDAELIGDDTVITVAGEGQVTLENVDATSLMESDNFII